jgi:hypothetical protein
VVEYNQLREVRESRNPTKGEDICMVFYNSFGQSSFYMNNKQRVEKKSLEIDQPWSSNSRAFWRIFGAYLE